MNKLLTSVALVIAITVPVFSQHKPNGTPNVVRGTINVVLANGNGFVVETDSMQTLMTPLGNKQSPEPAQKLFVLDDRTVCTIAGFGSINMPSAPEFNASSAGIIALYKLETGDQMSSRPFIQKLQDISHLFEFYLATVSNLSAVLQGHPKPGDFSFELLLAGYDSDGTPKIGFLSLKTTVSYDGEGRPTLDTHNEDTQTASVSNQLQSGLAGWGDVARPIIRAKMDDPSHGASLSLEEMRSIADGLIDKTAQKHPEVGGEHQVAVLANGRILSVTQTGFPAPTTPPARLLLMMEPFVQDSTDAFVGTGFLCIRGHFEKTRVLLDGNYYYRSDFVDAKLAYDGGPLNFPSSNHIVRSTLVLGPRVNRKSREVQWLIKSFPWKQIN